MGASGMTQMPPRNLEFFLSCSTPSGLLLPWQKGKFYARVYMYIQGADGVDGLTNSVGPKEQAERTDYGSNKNVRRVFGAVWFAIMISRGFVDFRRASVAV
jgi:hypothetical protein